MTHTKADIALQELLDGNQRYAAGRQTHPHQTTLRRQELVPHQAPFAIILGCADSRVPPEVIFDQGLGDLFVVRVAGNIVDEAVLGSLEYAAEHLKTPLLVVLGHKSCGAVRATAEILAAGQVGEGRLKYIVKAIQPAVARAEKAPGDLLENATRFNVLSTVEQLENLAPFLSTLVQEKKLKICGMYYDLESGTVELLD
jgi:carbonic anhydrase